MKFIKITTLLSLSAITLMGASQVTFAEDAPAGGDTPAKNPTSKAIVKLTAGDGSAITPPIDKDTPDEDITNQHGPLSIDVAPNFDFGTDKIGVGTTDYPIKNTNNPYAQVTDSRGTGSGWHLRAKITEFETADKSNKLTGATLTLVSKELQTTNPQGVAFRAPVAESITLNDSPQNLLSAAAGNGLGTWANYFDKDASKLTIPGGNLIGEYTATLEWSLATTPDAQ
ncbi:WxL domain-containing protein [Enterococcus rotai]|uniref:WxL domain-containing protein n=1 Tax=Enterococcus rotai TaxID=118060 RepID=UPI0035C7840E